MNQQVRIKEYQENYFQNKKGKNHEIIEINEGVIKKEKEKKRGLESNGRKGLPRKLMGHVRLERGEEFLNALRSGQGTFAFY